MKSKTYAARNVHLATIMAYLFIPMLVLSPTEPSEEYQIEPPEIATGGIGGAGWIIIEEPPKETETLNQFEALFSENVANYNLQMPQRAFYTGNSEPAEIRRVNWMKVAPTSLPVTKNIVTSKFGWRPAPCNGCSNDHQGVDFTPGYGTPVFAAMDGVVTDKGFNGSFGEYIILEHVVPIDNEVQRWETVYAHLERDSIPVEIQIGTIVERKQEIGKVGNTGQSTGPHLHFEIRIEGEAVDPLPLLGNYQIIRITLPDGEEVPPELQASNEVQYEIVYE